MMHRFHDKNISDDSRDKISSDLLDYFLKYLSENNYSVLPISEVVNNAKLGHSFYKTVCFTIDDGYLDFKTIAYPLFKKYNFPATVFVVTDFLKGNLIMWWDKLEYIISKTESKKIDIKLQDEIFKYEIANIEEKPDIIEKITERLKKYPHPSILQYLHNLSEHLKVDIPKTPPIEYSAFTWTALKEMSENNIEFQPHTVNHAILGKIENKDQEWQISESARELKKRSGISSKVFCYPNGKQDDYNEDTINILKKENFKGGCTGHSGFFNPVKDKDLFKLKRIPIPSRLNNFIRFVSGFEILRSKINEILRNND